MSIIYPYFLNSAAIGATTFKDLTDTPAVYTGAGGKVATVKVLEDGIEFLPDLSNISILFDNDDARFFSELGLPSSQGWLSGNDSIFSDTIFGVKKDSIQFQNGFARQDMLWDRWVQTLADGASFSSVFRFESRTSENSIFAGLGFEPANDPRIGSNVRSRILLRINLDDTYTTVNLENGTPIALNGQAGVPLVLINEWFHFEVVIHPTPDEGFSFGAVDLYINGILVSSSTIQTATTSAADNVIKVNKWSAAGDVVYYVDNFGITIYKEPAVKMLTNAEMGYEKRKIIVPGGKRNYEIIIPNSSPSNIGDSFSLIATSAGGTVTFRAEDLNNPQVLFNGHNSLAIYIDKKKEILFTNVIANGNVYEGTITLRENSNQQVNLMSTGSITYAGIKEGLTLPTNKHSILGAQVCQFVDKKNNVVMFKEFEAEEVLVDNTLLTGETTQVIHFFRDIDGNVIQSGEAWPTADQRRELVYCGNADINNTYTSLTSWNNPNRSVYGGGSDLTFDILETIGGMKGKGHKITASATGLTFNLGSGLGIRYGGNFGSDERPHTPDSPSLTFGDANFTSFVKGSKAANGLLRFGDVATALDPNNFQLLEQNDDLTPVPAGKFTIQKVYRYPGTNFVLVEYGSRHYNLIEQAEANVLLEPYNLDAQLVPAMFLGWIIMKQGITDHLAVAIANGEAKIINHDGAIKPTWLSADATTFLDTKNIEIYQDGQLESLATNGVITITEDNVFTFKNAITTAVSFNVVAGATLVIRGAGLAPLTWTGAGVFITSVLAPMHIQNITLIADNEGTLLDLSGDINTHVVFNFCVCIGWKMGNVYNTPTSAIAPQFYIEISAFFDWSKGLVCTNTTDVGITDCTLLQLEGVSANEPFITMQGNVPVGLYSAGTTGNMEAGESFLSIDPQISNDSRIQISSQSLKGEYFKMGGASGTFTVIADASISLTSITSVSSSVNDVARFNYTGSAVFINQEVVISGFVIVDNENEKDNRKYNGTHTVIDTGATWFEVAVAFEQDEAAGSFLSNSITLTDIGTSLVDGNTLTILSDSVLEYDGGAVVYNKQTDSFQISRTFSVTQAGTWNTAGIDQTDRRIIASNNPSQQSSKYIGAGYVNGNVESNMFTAYTNETFIDIVFGIGTGGIITASNAERWKIIDPISGIFEYTGNEPFSGFIDYNLTSKSSGGAESFRYKWVVDFGGGYENLPDDKYSANTIGATPLSTSDKIPLALSKGDRVKPQISRESGTSSHTTVDFSVSITA